MNNANAVWLVIVLAILAANLPFLNDRWLGVVPRRALETKGLALRLLEWVVLYFAVGATGLAIENHLSQIYPQNWEFYAVTAFLFATLAFPGFVYRYLWRKR